MGAHEPGVEAVEGRVVGGCVLFPVLGTSRFTYLVASLSIQV
jgi:hypothetical protein